MPTWCVFRRASKDCVLQSRAKTLLLPPNARASSLCGFFAARANCNCCPYPPAQPAAALAAPPSRLSRSGLPVMRISSRGRGSSDVNSVFDAKEEPVVCGNDHGLKSPFPLRELNRTPSILEVPCLCYGVAEIRGTPNSGTAALTRENHAQEGRYTASI